MELMRDSLEESKLTSTNLLVYCYFQIIQLNILLFVHNSNCCVQKPDTRICQCADAKNSVIAVKLFGFLEIESSWPGKFA